MRHNPTDAYQADDDPPTLTFRTADRILAIPYHLVRSMQLAEDESRTVITYTDWEATITGTNLGRLWRELRAYRVLEVAMNGGVASKTAGNVGERCLIKSIVVVRVDAEEPE